MTKKGTQNDKKKGAQNDNIIVVVLMKERDSSLRSE